MRFPITLGCRGVRAVLDKIQKGLQNVANSVQDMEAQLSRLVADVKRIADDQQAILDKLAVAGQIPQADMDALTAANDKLEAAAAAAEAVLNPTPPPAP